MLLDVVKGIGFPASEIKDPIRWLKEGVSKFWKPMLTKHVVMNQLLLRGAEVDGVDNVDFGGVVASTFVLMLLLVHWSASTKTEGAKDLSRIYAEVWLKDMC